MAIADHYKIQRSGKDVVLYPGLLNEAHSMYKHLEIDTELVQPPLPDNGMIAIVKANAYGEDDAEPPLIRLTSGIGDASPDNVNKTIVPHLIRMAETRAKARALRDLINLAEALADDPVDDTQDHVPESSVSHEEPPPSPSEGGSRGRPQPDDNRPQTPSQSAKLERLLEIDAKQLGKPFEERKDEMQAFIEMPVEKLSAVEAARWIRRLEQGIERRKEASGN